LPSHKTEDVINFLINNKINTIYNAPYMNNYNAVELTFRSIKKMLYSNLYDSIDDANKAINNYLNSKLIGDTLLYNFKENICQYISYYEQNKYINLNNFKFDK
jgi:transposase